MMDHFHPDHDNIGNCENILQIANKRVFGNEKFRNNQEEIIEEIMRQRDVYVIMPTGGGKSLLYQLPAILSKGLTVVISPLISLIEDQVSYLTKLKNGGVPAAYITSSSTAAMNISVFEDLSRATKGLEPHLKLLYVTPEGIIKSSVLKDHLTNLYMNEMLARFVIDESHCVSTWGHDFRKEYSKLGCLKHLYPDIPIVALTATARRAVSVDTIEILKMNNCASFNNGYDRPNLMFEVRPKPHSPHECMKCVCDIIQSFPKDSTGIVYCMTKKNAEALSHYLRSRDISSNYYHAGQSQPTRKAVQSSWQAGGVKVVCATIAYGMGIDKPDVRYVIHLSIAKSLEGYYQEAGRAGRDGGRSDCICLYSPHDVRLMLRIMAMPPTRVVSPQNKARLEEINSYCLDTTACRRFVFANAFGDVTNFKNCGNMCDNCLRRVNNRSHCSHGVDSVSSTSSSYREIGDKRSRLGESSPILIEDHDKVKIQKSKHSRAISTIPFVSAKKLFFDSQKSEIINLT